MKKEELKKAVATYAPVFESDGVEAAKEAMQADGLADADIAKVIDALTPKPPKEEKPKGFDEWLCNCKKKEDGSIEVEKLKKVRSGVTITAEQADILNEVKFGNNPVPVSMYFPAE